MSGRPAIPERTAGAAGPVVVLAALDRELAVLEAVTRVERRWTTSRFRAVLGRLDGMSVILARTGDGAENATRGSNELLSRLPVQSVIVVGMSFSGSRFLEFPPRALSLRWYAAY